MPPNRIQEARICAFWANRLDSPKGRQAFERHNPNAFELYGRELSFLGGLILNVRPIAPPAEHDIWGLVDEALALDFSLGEPAAAVAMPGDLLQAVNQQCLSDSADRSVYVGLQQAVRPSKLHAAPQFIYFPETALSPY